MIVEVLVEGVEEALDVDTTGVFTDVVATVADIVEVVE